MLTRLHARFHYGLSQAHRSRGNRSGDRAAYEGAIGELSLTLVLDPARAPGYFARGLVYWLGQASAYGQQCTPAGSGPQARPPVVGEAGSLVLAERIADFERYLELGKNGYGTIEAHNQVERMQGSTS